MKNTLTIYRIIELILCAVALCTGALYLWVHILPLDAVLPILLLCFAAIPVCRYAEGRKNGFSGIALWMPVLAMSLVAFVVLIAWIAFLAG